MPIILSSSLRSLVLFLFGAGFAFAASVSTEPSRHALQHGWRLQCSRVVTASPETISSPGFACDQWLQASVPCTVLAAQVAGGVVQDPFPADNLLKLPGMRCAADGGKDNPYSGSWWYRVEFRLPDSFRNRRVWLHFKGINTKANVWVNGARIADSRQVAGAFRIFELELTDHVRLGDANVLAVEVFPPGNNDFGINLVDWLPTPPDMDMGLWREVFLTASGPVRVRYPSVSTHFPGESLAEAELTARVELCNDSARAVKGTLRANVGGRRLERSLELAAGEKRSVVFSPDDYPQLKVRNPDLWWPAGWGAQTLHPVSMTFEADGAVSDKADGRFGIREISSELYGDSPQPGQVFNNNGDFSGIRTDERPLLLKVNRRPIVIRGGGWCPDMLLRSSPERLRAEFRYVLDMHLNALRLEGKLGDDVFFDLADEMGILILAGWCCGDRWEHWDSWTPNDHVIANESLRTQILRLRGHPCLALWMNGSDNPPRADVERDYLAILRETAWPNPAISSATAVPTPGGGPTGVKMTGPYDYVPPAYWLLDTHHFGGAFGFNTETSPGAAVPDLGSLRKFLPEGRLWPVNELWDLHAGAGGLNNNIRHFQESMAAIYGAPAGLGDFLRKAQAMDYDGERAMFEAYARNKYRSTGVIQWMLNNGWPSVIWHLYDYYLQPAAGYFGTKKACEPLHIQYSYDDHSVVVVSDLDRELRGLSCEAALYDFQLHPLHHVHRRVDVPADGVLRVAQLPEEKLRSGLCFLRLSLADGTGRVLSTNFYWLPSQISTFDWSQEQAKEHPYYTAVKQYEDLSTLSRLPEVSMTADIAEEKATEGRSLVVRVTNPEAALAFQVHLALEDAESGREVLPVLWEDNYVSLLPGETRCIHVRTFDEQSTHKLVLKVDGWNVRECRKVIPGPN